MAENWYTLSKDSTLEKLSSNTARGLTTSEAQTRLEQFGANELVEKGGRTPLKILWEQLTGFLTLLLFAAAGVSIFLGDYIDAVVILLIVVLNAALGFSQEYKAEQSMAALKRMSVPHVRVRRDGHVVEITARELVPGDIVLLETGNMVPADGRVTESVNLRAQEAALTGESEAVNKSPEHVYDGDRALGDRRNMVYSGTIVNYGHGEFVVTDTGMTTELGKIAEMIQSVEEELTPLQQRLDKLGKTLAGIAIALVAIIFVLGWIRGGNLEELLLTSVSLAVAAIPEALTAVVTIALSLGAQRMFKRKALIRKLPAVETLGSVSVICSDKTGTLTKNQMTVTVLDVANHRLDLQQTSDREGLDLRLSDQSANAEQVRTTLDLLLIAGALANDAVLERHSHDTNDFYTVGDPTEGALVLAAAQLDLFKPELDAAFDRVYELPFDSVRKRMTTVHRVPTSSDNLSTHLVETLNKLGGDRSVPYVAFVKGALDGLLDLTREIWVEGTIHPFDEEWRKRVIIAHDELAAKGMRILGVGMRPLYTLDANANEQDMERDLVFLGLVGMIDPPRLEVSDAVAKCKTAGIRTVMITGDHPLTARHIAQQIGISTTDLFITGQELDKMSEDDIREAVKTTSVFARVSPEHKLKLIQAYQDMGLIVSMTGDGVNDAPALKKADIGVAMGITGTDVSKEASEMILLDDNFATIVAAVEEGRIIYDNIRKFIKYLLTCNASEIAVMLIGPFLGMPLPLLPLQILWMNLVTDGLPALALGVEPAEKNVMERPPYSAQESIFGRGMPLFIGLFGVLMSILSLGAAYFYWQQGNDDWQTVVFTTLIFAQIALALEVRSEEYSLFRIGLFSNPSMILAVVSTVGLQLLVIYVPFFQRIFNTRPLTFTELLATLLVGALITVAVEIYKAIRRRK